MNTDNSVDIERIPVKIRQPIHREFCKCTNLEVATVDEVPYFFIADYISYDTLKKFLDSTDFCMGLYFSDFLDNCLDKIELALSYEIPVYLFCKELIPKEVLQKMGRVSHSAICFPIEFLKRNSQNRLGDHLKELKDFQKMLNTAKSLRVYTSVCIPIIPVFSKRLDLLELIDFFKSCCSHIFFYFPHIEDMKISEPYTKSLHTFYDYDIIKRRWFIKEASKDKIGNYFKNFIRYKKISIEILDEDYLSYCGKFNHTGNLSKNPLGIRPSYFIRQEEGQFIETSKLSFYTCPFCKKALI